jgi:predicted dehydrogenase
MEKVRWGMIGCGQVSEVKSGPGFQKVRRSSLEAVMCRDGEAAKSYAARHNVPKWYQDAQALINNPQIDSIYIATPPSSHKEYTLAAARAGKAVYVEKPMGISYAECLEMIHACQVANVPLYTAYYRRALPRFLKVKSLLLEGQVGQVRYVSVTLNQPPRKADLEGCYHWRIDPDISGGGYFYEQCCHMIDLLLFYFGSMQSVVGQHSNQAGLYAVDDIVSAVFRFESGVYGTGIWNFNTFDDLDRTEVVGSEGKITYPTFTEGPVVLEKDGARQEFFIENPEHAQQPLIQTVVDDILGKGNCLSTGVTGAETNRVLDAILGR